MTAKQIRQMKPDERLRHYEQDKAELFYRMKDMTPEEIREAREAIQKKWKV